MTVTQRSNRKPRAAARATLVPVVSSVGVFNESMRRAPRRAARLPVLVFLVAFAALGFGSSYLLSGGKPIFGPDIAGVSSDDMFYRLFVEDESRDRVKGPQGGPESGRLKLYTYTVGKDDSISRISKKTGVPIDALISLNKLEDATQLSVGTRLTIPNQRGIYYRVRKGDSLGGIAKRFKVEAEEIKRVNGIDPSDIRPEAVVFLPGVRLSQDEVDRALGLIFRSPAAGGWVSSSFGYRRDPFTADHRFHTGVDIALPYWTPVRAVRSGRVEFSGWQGGYGKLVVIRHTEGYVTKYGHLIKYTVNAGQWVRAGQLIGNVGSTGRSTGPHLHFEMWQNGRLLNPFQVQGFVRAYRRGN